MDARIKAAMRDSALMREYAAELAVMRDRALDLGWRPEQLAIRSTGRGHARLVRLDQEAEVATLAEVWLAFDWCGERVVIEVAMYSIDAPTDLPEASRRSADP